MNTPTIITLIALGIMLVDACPIASSVNGSCCEVKSNAFKFSRSLKSRVYNITNFCGDCDVTAEGYCDADTDGGGYDGWWFKGEKMAVLILTEDGKNMKKDLVASLVNSGMGFIHYTA